IFIWGDDKEYTCRLTKYYGPAYMVGDSIVTHKRAIAKSISIENETDPDRIKQFYYNYRNILINVNEYQRGFLSVAKRILGFNALSLKILRDKKQTYRWKKVLTIHKGIWGFIFGSYDRKKFKHRFEKES
ncbi:MAG: hypothetical protein LUC91_02125, partial [Prevotella sp.]|nr:hypothetical protein [Prevotella sp.]